MGRDHRLFLKDGLCYVLVAFLLGLLILLVDVRVSVFDPLKHTENQYIIFDTGET